jgi:hypothetical protein
MRPQQIHRVAGQSDGEVGDDDGDNSRTIPTVPLLLLFCHVCGQPLPSVSQWEDPYLSRESRLDKFVLRLLLDLRLAGNGRKGLKTTGKVKLFEYEARGAALAG